MPLTDLKFKPGINKETTPYSEDNGWVNCDKIRFRFGFPEKLNGWEKNSNNAFLGQCRGLNEWVSNNGTHYLGLGTEVKFYVKEGTAYKDVTPLRQTTSAGDVKFTCTTYNANTPATAFITVTDANHGAVVTDFVTFSGAAQLGSTNITASVLNQEYQITEIVDGNNYKFLPRALATIQSITVSGGLNETPVRPNGSVSVGGGNSVVGAYQIGTALNNAVFGTGWGAGLWGGTTDGALTTTLNDPGGISDSDTTIILTNATGFVANDFIMIGTELIKIGSVSTNTLSSCVRAQLGTSAAAHADTSTVQLAVGNTNTSDDFIGWGDSINSTSQTSTSNLRIWAQDNYGEDLIFNERNGGVFYWDTTNGVNTRAKFLYDSTLALRSPVTGNLLVLTSVPTVALQVLMSDRDRHIIAFGVDGLGANPSATTGDGVLDSLLIRFCSQEDPVDWYPTALNTSGDLRLSSGSTIVQALETRQQILVFTDVSLHSMQYLGTPLTFGLSLISENITIASPKSAVAVGDNVFWMGTAEFYIFSGSVERIPCTVRDFVFDNLNTSQSDKIVAGANVSFAEVWWFYPSANSTENDSYVVYNYMEKLWFTGTLARTAWLDRGVSQYPVATGTDNFLFNQEIGAKDDGSAMTSFVESGDMRMPSGNQFSFISRVIPDVNFRETVETSALSFVMEAKNFPGQVGQTSSTNAVTKTSSNPVDQYTTSYQTRLRGRSFTFKVSSTDENILWRLGVPRIDIRPDGKR
jgi:hypothetical protein|tara:strand:- start:21972 stop:24221 length:2250 start_codon:yes stop_codon:yes gene_type:complete